MNFIAPFPKFEFESLFRPQKLEKDDYQKVVDLAVEDLKKNKDVVAIYLMGKDWLPGISDLDMIVVYRDGVSELKKTDPGFLSEKARYIFTHDYLHFTESFFKDIYYVYPPKFEPYLLYGRDISLADPKKELSEKEYDLLQASLAMDFLLTKLMTLPLYLKEHLKDKTVKISTRKTLPYLYSFIYTIEMVEEITRQKISSDFPEKIKSLKNNWFFQKKEENEKLLYEAIKEGRDVTMKLVGVLDNFFRVSFNLNKTAGKSILTLPEFYFLGTEKWDEQRFFNEFSRSKGCVRIKNPISGKVLWRNFKLLVPDSFFVIFYLYAKAGGSYGNWFRKFLKCPDFHSESRGIAKRMEVINKIPIKENGQALFSLPFHYGFYTVNYGREALKVKLVSLIRALKLC